MVRFWTSMVIAALLLGPAVFAQEAVQVKRVALFKNGFGFFTATVTLPDAATVQLEPIPIPTLGTFWASYPDSVDLRGVFVANEAVSSGAPTMASLLQANAGKRARVFFSVGDTRDFFEGVIQPRAESQRSVYTIGANVLPPTQPYQPPQTLLLQTDTGMVALDVTRITHLELPDAAAPTEQRPAMRLELKSPAPGQEVTLSFLAKGITWSPSYRIDLSGPEQATVSAHAVLLNEAADLEEAQVELVTGYPHTLFSEIPSPLAKSLNLVDFLNTLAQRNAPQGGFGGGGFGGVAAQQMMITSNMAYFDAEPPAPAYPQARPGEVAEDLFFYPLEPLTLKMNETAYLPLFTEQMPYKHIYTWKVGDTAGGPQPPEAEGQPAETVWHCCRLTNTLLMPLTTAPAQFMSEGNYIGQDTCYYTPPGAETTIRINRAMNVVAKSSEVEAERTRDATEIGHVMYDLVTMQGELKLRSRLQEEVTVEIRKELSGVVVASSPEAEETSTDAGLKQVNPGKVLTWEVPLKAGEELTLTYSYELYVRN